MQNLLQSINFDVFGKIRKSEVFHVQLRYLALIHFSFGFIDILFQFNYQPNKILYINVRSLAKIGALLRVLLSFIHTGRTNKKKHASLLQCQKLFRFTQNRKKKKRKPTNYVSCKRKYNFEYNYQSFYSPPVFGARLVIGVT